MTEDDVVYLGGQTVLRLRPRQRDDVSAARRRDRGAHGGAPTPAAVADMLHRSTGRRSSAACRRSSRRSSPAPAAPPRRRRRCAAASRPARRCPSDVGGRWQRALRRRHPRRHRLDRDAAHLPLEPPGDVRYGTTGKPVPGYDVKLVGDDGETVGARRDGRSAVRGPTSAVMYWNNREQSRARSTASGRARATNTSWTRTATTCTAAGATTCSRSAASGSRRSRSRRALHSHPDVLEAAVVGTPDDERLDQAEGVRGAEVAERRGDEAGRGAAGALPGAARAVQISALDRVRAELPKTATGKDSALQAARRGGSALSRLWRRRDRLSRRKIADFLLSRPRSLAAHALRLHFQGITRTRCLASMIPKSGSRFSETVMLR